MITAAGLASAGKAIGGLGSLASGLGIGKKGFSYKDAHKAGDAQARNWAHMFQRQQQEYKKAGIHPLYALGGGSAQSSAPTSYHDGGPDFQQMGQGLSRALNAGQDYNTRKLLEEGAQLDIQRKKLENKHLETQIAASQMRLSRTAGIPSLPASGSSNRTGNVAHLPSEQESAATGSRGGIAAGMPPA